MTAEAFNRVADKYQEQYMDIEGYVDTYNKFCQLIKNDSASILEIGCGPGNTTRYLLNQRSGFRILGIDIAHNMVAQARKNVPKAKFLMMDCRDIEFIKQEFDAVVCGFCIPYLDKMDVATLIVKLRQKLNKGGVLYLSTVEDKDELNGMQTIEAGEQVYIHHHQVEFLKQQLIENKFEIIDVERKQTANESKQQQTNELFIYAKAI